MDDLAEKYRLFAERECKDYSPAYYHLALEIAEDAEVLGFVAQQPVTQPNLLFASVQYLTGPERMPLSSAAMRGFLQRDGKSVAALMRDRRTQTNEVGRCATLLPALPSGPIALVEVGASAGLCLLLDKYYYEYGLAHVGDAGSPVQIRCKANGPVPVPGITPEIIWRRGLDLNPLDVRRHDDAAWLLACVWPDHPERRRRLQAAISLARQEPPIVIPGDLVADLPELLAKVPPEGQLVVFHSATLPYVAEGQRRELARVLTEQSHERDVMWISNEGCEVIHELAAIAPQGTDRAFLLGKTILRRGQRVDSVLALAHPHGAELTWLK